MLMAELLPEPLLLRKISAFLLIWSPYDIFQIVILSKRKNPLFVHLPKIFRCRLSSDSSFRFAPLRMTRIENDLKARLIDICKFNIKKIRGLYSTALPLLHQSDY